MYIFSGVDVWNEDGKEEMGGTIFSTRGTRIAVTWYP